MFLGEYSCRIDEKGRIFVPKKLLNSFSDGIAYFTVFDDTCWMSNSEGFDFIRKTILSMSDSMESSFDKIRALCGSTHTSKISDKFGRVTLPISVRSCFGKEILLVGVNNVIELWNPELYNSKIREEQLACLRQVKEELKKEESFTYTLK